MRWQSRGWLLVLLWGGFVGCGQAPATTQQVSVSPAEADLDWAMQRLQRALDLSKPTGRTGLLSKRKMRYAYQAPRVAQANPTAVVTIETLSIFLHGKFSPQPKDTSAEAHEQETALVPPEEFADPGNPEQADYANQQPAFQPGTLANPAIVDTPVPPRRKEESKTYHLVFQNGKWRLLNEPEVAHERLWFEYALQ